MKIYDNKIYKDEYSLGQYKYQKELSLITSGGHKRPEYYEFVYIGNGFNTKDVIRMKEYLGAKTYFTPGWYATIPPKDYIEIHNWCKENIKDFTTGTYFVRIGDEKDLVLFSLRWA